MSPDEIQRDAERHAVLLEKSAALDRGGGPSVGIGQEIGPGYAARRDAADRRARESDGLQRTDRSYSGRLRDGFEMLGRMEGRR